MPCFMKAVVACDLVALCELVEIAQDVVGLQGLYVWKHSNLHVDEETEAWQTCEACRGSGMPSS